MMINEKLEKKYGDPLLKQMAKTDLAKDCYGQYLSSQREKHTSEIHALIAYILATLLVMLSAATEPYIAIPGAMLFCIGTQCSCDAKTEALWSMRFIDCIFEVERVHKVQEAVEKIKESENVFEAVEKEGKK